MLLISLSSVPSSSPTSGNSVVSQQQQNDMTHPLSVLVVLIPSVRQLVAGGDPLPDGQEDIGAGVRVPPAIHRQ